MLGLLSTCIGAGMSLGALLIGLIVSAFSIQWTISLNSLAGLLLIVPAIVFTPLPWQTVSQIVEDSDSVAEPDDEEA
jgi:MFS family permease